jgi:oligoribonuclease NrnB/cAMP/cGMP phosphodiesterase (DHH superfamily)
MKVLYHFDADGKAAAHIVAKYHGLREQNPEDYFEMNYINPVPLDKIAKDETVYIVDFSIKPEQMDKLLEITQDVIWIDHHETAIDMYRDYPNAHLIKGVRQVGTAGCMLTYLYLYPYKDEDDVPMPIRYIADRDVWTWAFGDETQYFHNGISIIDLHPLSDNWKYVFEAIQAIIDDGFPIEQYKVNTYKEWMKEYSHKAIFENYDAIVLNADGDSKVFGDEYSKHDLAILYTFTGKVYTVSLYSETIHVGNLAIKYGGGGHESAAGFTCTELPWEIV